MQYQYIRAPSNNTDVGLLPIPQVNSGHDCTAKQDCDESSHASTSQECSHGSEDMSDWVKAFINHSMANTDCNIDLSTDQGDGYG